MIISVTEKCEKKKIPAIPESLVVVLVSVPVRTWGIQHSVKAIDRHDNDWSWKTGHARKPLSYVLAPLYTGEPEVLVSPGVVKLFYDKVNGLRTAGLGNTQDVANVVQTGSTPSPVQEDAQLVNGRDTSAVGGGRTPKK